MVNAIQARPLFIDRIHNPPGRFRDMGAGQHLFLGFGVILPPAARMQIHGAELPLLERIFDAHLEAGLLFLVGDGEPVFDQDDAGPDEHSLEIGNGLEELFALLICAKSHHALDASPIVPAAVKQHDLASGGQMRDITLEVPLRPLPIIRGRQRHHLADARVKALRDALDGAPFASRIPAFEDDDDLQFLMRHPILKFQEFMLQAQ